MDNRYYTNNEYTSYSQVNSVAKTNKYLAGSFLWMFLGALITMAVGIGCTQFVLKLVLTSNSSTGVIGLLIAFIASFVFQMILTFKLHKNTYTKQNFAKALVIFVLYSALTGFTFSFIFAFFDLIVLNQVFAGVSLYFLLLAGLTYLFRNKIERASGFAFMGLMTLMVVSSIMLIVSMFAFNGAYFNALHLGISIMGILVFSIVTMVDMKRIKTNIDYFDNKKCAMIAGAFDLYLDFINIFIYILRILLILGKNAGRRN